MMNSSWKSAFVIVGMLVVNGCTCAKLPAATFECEPDGSCKQDGFVCGEDGLCREPVVEEDDAGMTDDDAGIIDDDAGMDVDSGMDVPDAGDVDAGIPDAGALDSGVDDAGVQDAGVDDAGVVDSGVHDAGTFDAGTPDAGGAPIDAGGPIDAGCIPTADFPDDLGLDTDCDGIDGESSHAAFVDALMGDDLNAGTRANPFATISKAAGSGKAQILVAEGTYAEDVTFSTAHIYGGYVSGTWARTGARPVISGNIVVVGDGGSEFTLDFLRVEAPAATDAGTASVAVAVSKASSTSIIKRSQLVAGRGANGSDGAPGVIGADGQPGQNGVAGDGGIFSGGGGNGGAGRCFIDGGPDTAWGGRGGFDGTAASPDGLNGSPVSLGGTGGDGVPTCTATPCIAQPGQSGTSGAVGSGGSVGSPSSTYGSITGGPWWVGGYALGGSAGSPGLGGGGGGGGGTVVSSVSGLVSRGGGGGGGGAAGCGGTGGLGGQMGGASISLILLDSSPLLSEVVFETTGGGAGGNGGLGALGGSGASGGRGGLGDSQAPGEQAGDGGVAASGSHGGSGGRGGGGANGPSIGIWCAGTAVPVIVTPTYTLGGSGGPGQPNGATVPSLQKRNCP